MSRKGMALIGNDERGKGEALRRFARRWQGWEWKGHALQRLGDEQNGQAKAQLHIDLQRKGEALSSDGIAQRDNAKASHSGATTAEE